MQNRQDYFDQIVGGQRVRAGASLSQSGAGLFIQIDEGEPIWFEQAEFEAFLRAVDRLALHWVEPSSASKKL